MIVNGHITRPANGSLSIGELARFFGVKEDLGLVCGEANTHLNKHSKIKPIRFDADGVLTDAQRQSANYGIDCSDTSTGCFSASLGSLLARAKTNDEWTYLKPRGISRTPKEWYRIYDFDGYWQDARPPFVEKEDIVGNTTNDANVYINIGLTPIINNDSLRIADFTEALTRNGDAVADYRYAIIYRDSTTPSAAPSFISLGDYYTLTNLTTTAAFSVRFAPPASYNQAVIYDCAFIAYVEHGGSYWATFLPGTYFQARLALFDVRTSGGSVTEGQVFEVAKTGGLITLYVSGFGWQSSVGGDDMIVTINPSSNPGSTSVFREVEITVGNGVANPFGEATKTITFSAPGLDGVSPDFTKSIKIHQPTDYNNFVMAVDSQGHAINQVEFESLSPEYVTAVTIRSNVPWRISSIVWDDDETSDNPNTGPNSITASPTTGGTSGNITNTVVDFWADDGIVADRRYRVKFVSTNSQRPAEFTLQLIS